MPDRSRIKITVLNVENAPIANATVSYRGSTNQTNPPPEIEQRFAKLGVTRGDLSQPAFARFVDDEIDKWGRVIEAAKIPKQ